ncbi:unnamed protein product [Fusarium langsethiae]|nr:unnamed protein product [Fusarium langsethiae]
MRFIKRVGPLFGAFATSICETTKGVKAYSGYVKLPKNLLPDFQDWDDDQAAHVFLWYFETSEARKNPSKAPTSIYIGGGPGSTSFNNTNGFPCSVSPDSNSTTLNKLSWNNHVNMLYIDQPLGTGFSYVSLQNGTFDTITQTFTPIENGKIPKINATFLQATLDSGAPGTVPKTTMCDQNTLISNGKPTFENVTALNLATLGLLEPAIDARAMAKGYTHFGHLNTYGLQVFDDKTYKSIMQTIEDPKEERFGNNKTVNAACVAATLVYFGKVQGIYSLLSDRNPFDITHPNMTLFPPHHIDDFFNQRWVQQELGVPLNFTATFNNIAQNWLGVVGDPVIGSLHTLEKVIERGVNVAMVYGDRDYRCPWYGGENVSLSLEFPSAPAFRSSGYASISTNCSYDGGFVREQGNVSFSRILQSGHGVAAYQPETLSAIFERVMFRRDLATGKVDLKKHKDYKTKGPETVSAVKNKVPQSPANTCFLRLSYSCTDEQLEALAKGTAVVKDWIVVEQKGKKPMPLALYGFFSLLLYVQPYGQGNDSMDGTQQASTGMTGYTGAGFSSGASVHSSTAGVIGNYSISCFAYNELSSLDGNLLRANYVREIKRHIAYFSYVHTTLVVQQHFLSGSKKMIALMLFLFGTAVATAKLKPLATDIGHQNAIPNWDFQQIPKVTKDIKSLSLPNVDTSSWHHAPVSRCTLMACLLAEGTYKLDGHDGLWYSDNLAHFNDSLFHAPWVYRNQFNLETGYESADTHYFLQTNGITPAADLFLNGKQIANNVTQSGSYGGHTYDISSLVAKENALVVKVYPTDYQYDFAVGFVDWNPYSPDNGTGVWRDITIKKTGNVFMGAVSVLVDMDTPIKQSQNHHAVITVRAQARNLKKGPTRFVAKANIKSPRGKTLAVLTKTLNLGAGESTTVELSTKIQNPEIWWPAAWGEQHLYSAQLTYSIGHDTSDVSPVTNFGIRTVTSELNSHNDTMFRVNGYPIQITGGGYTSDMFLRWDSQRFEDIARYTLGMGMNTVRLEGKMEQPELYDIADRLGLMLMAGWECCDRWESWPYNHDLSQDPPPLWYDADYDTVNASMRHEAAIMQHHPSVIAFLIGSDYWPDDRATKIYLTGLHDAGWQVPIISSAAKRGYPKLVGPSGMKMEGPYDWVPPVYWFDREPTAKRFGSSFGFGSELGAGVGTPAKGSLEKFLTDDDMEDLWKKPNKGLYHMSQDTSQFHDRSIYNKALFARYGKPTSLDDYLISAQMMDYEAIRSEFEGWGSHWSSTRPATGLIYWMLNNAWPSLHWNQFDYYLHPAGTYFGTKIATRVEHVTFDYFNNFIWVINRSLEKSGPRSVHIELVDLRGKEISRQVLRLSTKPSKSQKVGDISSSIKKIQDVAVLRLTLVDDDSDAVLSRNAYWLSRKNDMVDWSSTTWYVSDVKQFANFTALNQMDRAAITLTASGGKDSGKWKIRVKNTSPVPAVFVQLNLVDKNGDDVAPLTWSDNYFTLLPSEEIQVELLDWSNKGTVVEIIGKNIKASRAQLR